MSGLGFKRLVELRSISRRRLGKYTINLDPSFDL